MTITQPSERSLDRTPAAAWIAHLVTLAAAAVFLVVISRGQWFFYDEWDFLRPLSSPADLFAPHVGHWSTAPMLLYKGLEQVFGLSSYWPYLLVSLAIHLGIAHMLWRIMLRIGTAPWIAVSASLLFMLYPAGSQNILWAFQTGYMGGMLLGLVGVLLADRLTRERYWRRYAVIVAVIVVALTFAGTALPLVLAVGIVAWRRAGFLRALLLLAPVGAVYGTWYVYASLAFPANPSAPPPATPGQFLSPTGGLEYAGRMVAASFSELTPWWPIGLALLVAVAVYFFATLVTSWRRRPVLIALTSAAVVFALLTAYSRLGYGMDSSEGGRYLYMVFALLLPLLGSAATWLARRLRWTQVVTVAGFAAIAVGGGFTISAEAANQRVIETETREVLFAAVDVLAADPHIPDSSIPEPTYAPTLDAGSLRELVAEGWFPRGPYDEGDRLTAAVNLQASVVDLPETGSEVCVSTDATSFTVPADGLLVEVPKYTEIRVTVGLPDGWKGSTRAFALGGGVSRIDYSGVGQATVEVAPGAGFEICR